MPRSAVELDEIAAPGNGIEHRLLFIQLSPQLVGVGHLQAQAMLQGAASRS